MTKHDLAQQIIDIQTLLELAKDNAIENNLKDAQTLLQRAIREIKQLNWRMPMQTN